MSLVGFGGSGWNPLAGDYDGDGKADLVVYQESTSTWQFRLSASGYALATTSF